MIQSIASSETEMARKKMKAEDESADQSPDVKKREKICLHVSTGQSNTNKDGPRNDATLNEFLKTSTSTTKPCTSLAGEITEIPHTQNFTWPQRAWK